MDQGGPGPVLAQGTRRQGAHLATKKSLVANYSNYQKRTCTREERKALKQFKDAYAFPKAAGCWVCGKENHRAFLCPVSPKFDQLHPELALSSLGKYQQA